MPDIGSVHIDQALTNLSQAVMNEGFAADKIFPVLPVKKDSDKYFVYDKANLRVEKTDWAPKTQVKEVNWDVSTDNYKTERHGLGELVEDDEVDNADTPLSPMMDTTEVVTEKLLLRREKKLATLLTTTGTFDSDARPAIGAAGRWDNYGSSTSDPNIDIQTGRKTIFGKLFRKPNTLVLPYLVYETVREHPKVLERVKYVSEAVVDAGILARLWNVENVVIAGTGENTAIEGQADVLAQIWGKNAWLGYVEPRPGRRRMSWGYAFRSQNMLAERWRDNPRKGEMLRISYKEIHKVVTSGAGYWMQTVIN